MGWKIWGPRQREGAIAATFRRLRLHVPICKENRQSGNAPPAGFSNILAHVFSGRFHLTSAIALSLPLPQTFHTFAILCGCAPQGRLAHVLDGNEFL